MWNGGVGEPAIAARRLEELETIIGKQDDLIQDLQKMAFELANYYFVSQTVVFAALAGESSLACHDVWFPMVLSLLPGFLNLYALALTVNKYKEVILHRDQSYQERELLNQECITRTLQHNWQMPMHLSILANAYLHRERVLPMKVLASAPCCQCPVGNEFADANFLDRQKTIVLAM
ncbi:hypothetical protein Vadar_001251 [Vaccinium darrowii]|nr:hypothetical protein Vadar_001251 [Vaccinium darrowii]